MYSAELHNNMIDLQLATTEQILEELNSRQNMKFGMVYIQYKQNNVDDAQIAYTDDMTAEEASTLFENASDYLWFSSLEE